MKVAIPVKDTHLSFFDNAGHTPYFAVYTIKGGGMFKSFDLEEVRPNPRTDLDHGEEEHHCSHDHEDAAHVNEHFKMAEAIQDCDFLITKRACKNTVKAMENYGVSIKKYNGLPDKADTVLNTVSSQLNK